MRVQVGEWMASRAYLLGDKEGFVGTKGSYTYREMNDRVNRFANYLLSQGVKAGERIALICKNHEDFIAAFFASAKIGVITIPVNWRLQNQETLYILQNSGARVVVYDHVFSEKIETIKADAYADIFICSGNSEVDPTFEHVLTSSENTEPNSVSSEDDTILIMYTSGTTGKPKGAMFSHENLLAASNGLTHTIDWSEKERFLLIAPFFHIGGFAPLFTNV